MRIALTVGLIAFALMPSSAAVTGRETLARLETTISGKTARIVLEQERAPVGKAHEEICLPITLERIDVKTGAKTTLWAACQPYLPYAMPLPRFSGALALNGAKGVIVVLGASQDDMFEIRTFAVSVHGKAEETPRRDERGRLVNTDKLRSVIENPDSKFERRYTADASCAAGVVVQEATISGGELGVKAAHVDLKPKATGDCEPTELALDSGAKKWIEKVPGGKRKSRAR